MAHVRPRLLRAVTAALGNSAPSIQQVGAMTRAFGGFVYYTDPFPDMFPDTDWAHTGRLARVMMTGAASPAFVKRRRDSLASGDWEAPPWADGTDPGRPATLPGVSSVDFVLSIISLPRHHLRRRAARSL